MNSGIDIDEEMHHVPHWSTSLRRAVLGEMGYSATELTGTTLKEARTVIETKHSANAVPPANETVLE
ncbi:hypothetical protein AXG93_2016s1420 [Marchantia polymorpha subsp. ruderalis]|uniref:Uncharacterized protein n=1 Tax=Marchantia polymorpha subsp. ruderalis TaxID=1480154 RepID=A0A176VVF6_MARPO|nr:hypothetical protein AXG93_2016s1420 [Marchantia polymorpha subsp. ruderalis]